MLFRSQRRAQLVAGVGEEPPGELLAGLTLVDGGLDSGEHPVEGRAQAAHLGGRILRADPVGEVTSGDAVGLGRHRLDGTQAAAHDPGDTHGDEQAGHRRADDEDELEPADGAVDAARLVVATRAPAAVGTGMARRRSWVAPPTLVTVWTCGPAAETCKPGGSRGTRPGLPTTNPRRPWTDTNPT